VIDVATRRASDLVLSALAPASWGTTYVVTTTLLPADRPLLAATMRALPAGLVLLAVNRRLPTGSWWWKSVVLGMLNFGAFFPLLFFAAYRLPGGVAATIGSVQPLVVALLSLAVLRARPARVLLYAALAGTGGVALLTLTGSARLDPLGVGAMLLATSLMGLAIVLTKRWGQPERPLVMAGWQLTVGGLVLVPLTLGVEGLPSAVTGQNVLGFGYLGIVGTAMAYALWFRGIGRLAPTSLSLLGLTNPLVATLAGLIVLGQTLTGWQITGFAIALGALAVGQTLNRPAREREEPTTMRITVFGAAGSVGSRVVAEALARGHEVTAVVRDAARLAQIPAAADARTGDAGCVEDVASLSAGRDLVITATRPAPGSEHELVTTTKALLAGLAGTRVRLLVVGGAATLTVPGGGTVVDDPDFPAALRGIALACTDQLEACRAETDVDWAYLSPAAQLEPGIRTGTYRLGTDELLVDVEGNSTISMEDLAVALLDEAEHPKHHRTRFTAAY
jgi:probable blue pigment (indigoidine) exporter